MGKTQYSELRDQDPFAFYETQRERGPVVWDDSLSGWFVSGPDEVIVVHRDEALFAAPWPRLDFRDIFGTRSLFMLTGDEHDAMYDRIKGFFSKRFVDGFRAEFIRPLADAVVDQFASRGHAELASELAQEVPTRVIGAILGLDWQREGFGRDVWQWTEGFLTHTGTWILPNGGSETQAAAEASMAHLDELLRPVVEAGQTDEDNNYVAQLWSLGAEVFDDWSAQDVLDSCRFLFIAGVHTTSELLSSCIYLLATDQDLQDAVRRDRLRIPALIEEAMRLHPSMHVRMRYASEDTVLGGVAIEAGQKVFTSLASANRDPERFGCPAHLDLERRPIAAHLTFGRGDRACSGAPLARAEVSETLNAVLDRIEHVQLDPDQPAPIYKGFLQRGFEPLHVMFDPASS